MKEFGRKIRNTAIKVGGTATAAAIAMETTQGNPYVEVGVPVTGAALGKGTDVLIHYNEDALGKEYATGVSWLLRGLSIAGAALMWRTMGPNEITIFTAGFAAGSTEKAIRNGLSSGTEKFHYRRYKRKMSRLG